MTRLHPTANSLPAGSIELLEPRVAPATIVGLTSANTLIAFSSDDPGDARPSLAITGLQAGEQILGIDFRPATGELYGVGSTGRLYTIASSGAATLKAVLTPAAADAFAGLSGVHFGVDFNPTADRLRIVSDTDQSLRVHPDTGAVITDGDVTYFGAPTPNPNVTGSAYTNNFRAAPSTLLYGIDSGTDALVLQDPATGNLTTVGALGVPASALIGFDITTRLNADGSLTNTGFAILEPLAGESQFYTIDLATGAAAPVADLPGTATFRGMAAFTPSVSISANGRQAGFFDVDGDFVTITVSKGSLNASDFTLIATDDFGAGSQLVSVNFSDDGTEFAKANLTVSARPHLGFGDGRVNVGYIDARQVDLGKVVVDGDLGRIDAGNSTKRDGGLAGLTALSLGVLDTATQIGPEASLISSVLGKVGPISIANDITFATILVDADAAVAITSLTVGGTLFGGSGVESGSIIADGNISSVKIAGGLVAGDGARSGSIRTSGTIANAQVGSIQGGDGPDSGTLSATAGLGVVKVKFDVAGGRGDDSGSIESETYIRSVSIGGDLIGGGAEHSGSIYTGGMAQNSGAIGSVTIAGDMRGFGFLTGIISDATLGAVKIGGDLFNASITAEGTLGATTQKAALAIKSVTIGRSAFYANIVAGVGVTGVATNADVEIGAVTVKGNWVASNLVAGITDTGGDGYGDAEDELTNNGGDSNVVARIASVTVGGAVYGTFFDDSDLFGFVAQHIVRFKIADALRPLESGRENDVEFLSTSFDVILAEYGPAILG